MNLRNYLITMSRMSPLQIAWRFRRLALQKRWRNKQWAIPNYQLQDLLPINSVPFGYIPLSHYSTPIREKADTLCTGEFTFLNQSVKFQDAYPDWIHTPDGDPLWSYNLHYFEYGYELLWAYQLTQDVHYIQHLVALMENWIEKNPFWHEIAWNPYPLSRRLIVWSTLLQHLQHCPDIAKASLDYCASSLCQQITFLAANLEYDIDNNHLITNARALLWVGLIMGEHPEAHHWQRLGLQVLEREAKRQILPDGCHWERSASYQMVVLQDYLETILLLDHCKQPVPKIFSDIVLQMLTFLRCIIRPDGELPLLNDSIHGYPINLTALFSVGATYFNCSDFKFPTVEPNCDELNIYLSWLLGHSGCSSYEALDRSVPPTASVALAESGYYVMRSVAAETTAYLIFDCGAIGPAHSAAHAHADTLSFELVVGNQPIIIDPGVFEYKLGKWRNLFRSTQSHNTVSVDNLDQSLFWGNFRVADMANAKVHQWQVSAVGAIIEGEHDGYTRLANPVIHQRRIEQSKSLQWSITDTLENKAGGSHHYDWWFHLAPSQCIIDEVERTCSAQFASGIQLSIVVQESPEIHIALEEGWFSTQWKKKQKAPVIHLSCSSSDKVLQLTTVLTIV